MTTRKGQRSPWLLLSLLAVSSAFLVWSISVLPQSSLYQGLEQFTFWIGEGYDRWFTQQQLTNPLALVGLSFMGGLIASISPCILSLLPVNLSYIGTRDIQSRRDAFFKAAAFVLGVVTVLSLLGLFSSLASLVLVKFRGYFHLGVGLLIMLMSLSLSGMIRLPLPPNPSGAVKAGGWVRSLLSGPYGVGLTFALVSSPCTSPIMISILSAGWATGSQVQSMLAMVAYAFGYTAIIFLASLFAGLAKQTRWLLAHSSQISRIASLLLLMVGSFYLINGLTWIRASLPVG